MVLYVKGKVLTVYAVLSLIVVRADIDYEVKSPFGSF